MFVYDHDCHNFKTCSLLQTLDVPASLLASTLVAMEITISGLMKLGGYPSELLEMVANYIPILKKFIKFCVWSLRLLIISNGNQKVQDQHQQLWQKNVCISLLMSAAR